MTMCYQVFFFVFLLLFCSCNALICTTDCSFTYNLTTPFNIPDRCNQSILAGKCVGYVAFWYDRRQYDVSFQADPSSSISIVDNKRFVLLQFSSDITTFFSYSIDRACKNQDDCARDLIADIAIEMLQRDYNYSAIMDELQPIVIGPTLTPDDPDLRCYDSNQNIQQCSTSSKTGSCVIMDTVSKKKISVQCDTEVVVGNAYVDIYQSDNDYALFDVHCNRSVCNTRSTLQAAKEVAFRYGITITPDGRLDGSRLIRSTLLIIVMVLLLFSNQI